jgi:hypothetical protein
VTYGISLNPPISPSFYDAHQILYSKDIYSYEIFENVFNNVFNYANPDSEDVDKCLDQMISILHNAHQQFLHNFNSKSEISRSANSHKKLLSPFPCKQKLGYIVGRFSSLEPFISSDCGQNKIDGCCKFSSDEM